MRGNRWAPLRSASSMSVRPRTKSFPSAGRLVTRKPGPGCLKIWPPSVTRSSTAATESPAPAASTVAARPAGPPPTTPNVVLHCAHQSPRLDDVAACVAGGEAAGHAHDEVGERYLQAGICGSGAPMVAW